MGTQRTTESLRLEDEIRLLVPEGMIVECEQEFDTKDYIVWLTAKRSRQFRITLEKYADSNWKCRAMSEIEELCLAKEGTS